MLELELKLELELELVAKSATGMEAVDAAAAAEEEAAEGVHSAGRSDKLSVDCR